MEISELQSRMCEINVECWAVVLHGLNVRQTMLRSHAGLSFPQRPPSFPSLPPSPPSLPSLCLLPPSSPLFPLTAPASVNTEHKEQHNRQSGLRRLCKTINAAAFFPHAANRPNYYNPPLNSSTETVNRTLIHFLVG